MKRRRRAQVRAGKVSRRSEAKFITGVTIHPTIYSMLRNVGPDARPNGRYLRSEGPNQSRKKKQHLNLTSHDLHTSRLPLPPHRLPRQPPPHSTRLPYTSEVSVVAFPTTTSYMAAVAAELNSPLIRNREKTALSLLKIRKKTANSGSKRYQICQ